MHQPEGEWFDGRDVYFQDVLHRKKTGPNDPHKSIIKNIKYHQISLVHLFTCSIETISSTPNHKHYTIIYHTQFRHGKNLSDYRWQDRQVNELLIASRNTFLCFKSFRYDLPTGRVCKTGFPILPRFFSSILRVKTSNCLQWQRFATMMPHYCDMLHNCREIVIVFAKKVRSWLYFRKVLVTMVLSLFISYI